MQSQKQSADTMGLEQPPGVPGVLRGYPVDFAQDAQRSQGYVFHVTYWRGNNVQYGMQGFTPSPDNHGKQDSMHYLSRRIGNCLTAILILLHGCTAVSPVADPQGSQPDDTVPDSTAISTGHTTATRDALMHAWQFLDEGNAQQAEDMIRALDTQSLLPIEQIELDTLRSAILMSVDLPASELAIRELPAPSTLPGMHASSNLAQDAIMLGKRIVHLKATLHERRNETLTAIRELAAALDWLPQPLWNDIIEKIWKLLITVPRESLETPENPSDRDTNLAGWLELSRETAGVLSASRQQRQYSRWRQNHPQHPAAVMPPQELADLSRTLAEQPQRIAVFLPAQGPLGTAGEAIRNGILAAYYRHPHPLTLTFFDTTTHDIATLYSQAILDGADMILGPLDRNNLEQLVNTRDDNMTVLSLNYLTDPENILPGLLQFGLNPADETTQLIHLAHDEGWQRVILLYQDNSWGQRQAATFRRGWTAGGGLIVAEAPLTTAAKVREIVADVLDINVSEARRRNLGRTIGHSVISTPRARRDVDLIVLLAENELANAARPAFAYYFSGDIPVYATSRVIADDLDTPQPDLSGVHYTDFPWRARESSLKTDLASVIPSAREKLFSFYALGIDAFDLTSRIRQYRQLPHLELLGQTGWISLQSGHRFQRRLILNEINTDQPESQPQASAQGNSR